jgi:hypothetical protein
VAPARADAVADGGADVHPDASADADSNAGADTNSDLARLVPGRIQLRPGFRRAQYR